MSRCFGDLCEDAARAHGFTFVGYRHRDEAIMNTPASASLVYRRVAAAGPETIQIGKRHFAPTLALARTHSRASGPVTIDNTVPTCDTGATTERGAALPRVAIPQPPPPSAEELAEQLRDRCVNAQADLLALVASLRTLADSLREAEFVAWREGREDATADLAAADVANCAAEAQAIADRLA